MGARLSHSRWWIEPNNEDEIRLLVNSEPKMSLNEIVKEGWRIFGHYESDDREFIFAYNIHSKETVVLKNTL